LRAEQKPVKKVLVTGAGGFIGNHTLLPLIASGFEVHAIKNTSTMSSNTNVTWHPVDLFQTESVRAMMQDIRPSHLLHCAWLATPGVFWTSSDNVRWLLATIELARAFGEVGGKRAFGLGSCAEYDWSIGGVCSEAKTPLLPSSIYGKCKVAASQALSAISDLHGFSWVWGRLFFPYGPGEPTKKFISSVILHLNQGESIQCSHGRQLRDFLYVEDVADAIVALLNSELSGTYNVASGQAISLRDIVREITLRLGGQDLIHFGEKADQLNEPSVLIADMHHLSQQLAWRPKVDLTSGIERMIAILCETKVA
jgi:nucleoside-diphosphate-sugar epimerase